MREFQEKKRHRRILFSPLTVILLLFLIAFFSRAVWNVYQKAQLSAANAAAAYNELNKLQNRKKVLDTEVKRLQTNEGVEEEIRAKYSVAKPGEQIVVILNDKATETPATTTPPTLWQSLIHLLWK